MQSANNQIAPLQDAVDLDMATDVEKQTLADWKKYRVLLNRVDISTAPNIDWPPEPAKYLYYINKLPRRMRPVILSDMMNCFDESKNKALIFKIEGL
ncbi:tail fiber assembly protein [Erwinia amylovora]|nr:tail fiber assembly protein [Erwinia amylovora]EKV52761.1 putative tail fiber assembly protein [Erwinia amylovora ACW56400]CCO80189.1 Tail fiber assembly protein homolog from lambdoid prophage [Erwinia amylovora Ea356]CCO83992.1 Tail fiber assembly protein homolog from lambdoid prophage [Erwinia amylovora Ea266]CCO87755.1 Tail fiber assembly protein homolog from lambdoid prophage [Erwinia amylovora CFBP 2585]CCO91545.1 Tail fiber assembly protein homolog from lambdoid prophage [Erwinia amyl